MTLQGSNHLSETAVRIYEDGTPYVEIANSDELKSVLKAIPREAIPCDNCFYLTQDKKKLQDSIVASRRSKQSEWSRFLPLYDLHPIMQYYFSKFMASLRKAEAFVVKNANVPAGRSFYLFYGSHCNGLGHALVSEFFVVPLDADGKLVDKPCPFAEFYAEYPKALDYTQEVSTEHLKILKDNLDDAIDFANTMFMNPHQSEVSNEMALKLKTYQEKVATWKKGQVDFDDITAGAFSEDIRAKSLSFQGWSKFKAEEVEKISDRTSQFYRDLCTLDEAEPYLCLLAVIENL